MRDPGSAWAVVLGQWWPDITSPSTANNSSKAYQVDIVILMGTTNQEKDAKKTRNKQTTEKPYM